jgi:saccharopine dehydrogenase-like NADP-dependent oxidoreductase
VIYHYGVQQFDEVHVLNSYCGGIPEKKACTNALNYKISWNWDSVLKSQKREAVAIKDGKGITLSAENQHDNALIHEIDFPGLGRLEAFPNGTDEVVVNVVEAVEGAWGVLGLGQEVS